MNLYDYSRVFQLIEEHKNKIAKARLAIAEDYYWTAKTIWSEILGYLVDLEDPFLEISGINGSTWGTPMLYFYNADEVLLKAYDVTK